MHRSEPGPRIEWFGRGVLVLVVAGALILLVGYVGAGWLATFPPLRRSYPEHHGIELVLFPLAAAIAAIVRPRLGVLETLRARVGPALPLLAAAVLAALLCYLAWTWLLPGSWYRPERLLGAALVASAGVAGSVLFPRHTTVLAGAIAAPALFTAAVIAFPGLLHDPVDEAWKEEPARRLVLSAGGGVSLLLLAASVRPRLRPGRERVRAGWMWFLPRLAGRIRLRRHALSPAAWIGALTLLVGVWGYLWGLTD